LAYAMAPGALFEVTIGLWLAFKGISVKKSQTALTGSVEINPDQ